jgi:DUF4097 and DUF4098 domain-containing protein YvlB
MNKKTFVKSFFTVIVFVLLASVCKSFAQDVVLKEDSFQTASGKKLSVVSSFGNINITSCSKEQFSVSILGSSELKDLLDIIVNNLSDEIIVNVTMKKKENISNVSLTINISIPEKFNLDLKTSGGNIKVNNIAGDSKIKTMGGEINITGLTGQTKLETMGGDIVSRNLSGKAEIKTNGGNIDLTSSGCEIQAQTNGGNIILNYTGENKGIDLKTNGGDIEATIPSTIQASCNIHTNVGRITTDFSLSCDESHVGGKCKGDINNGGNSLNLETSAGNISLKKQ